MRRRNRLCGGVGGNVLDEYSANVPERPGRGFSLSPGCWEAVKRSGGCLPKSRGDTPTLLST